MAQSANRLGSNFLPYIGIAMSRKLQSRLPYSPPMARSAPPTIGLGVIGLGTVGVGTLRVLLEHRREIQRRLGCKLELKAICSRTIHKRDLAWLHQPVKLTPDWKQVVHDPEVDIVVELVGVINTSRAIAFAVLGAGKHLVTANKQLVAEYGVDLVKRSRASRVNLGIEACGRRGGKRGDAAWRAERLFCTPFAKDLRAKTLKPSMAS